MLAGKAPSKGVVILTHGLNLDPKRMDPLSDVLRENGYDVFRPAFSGHCRDDNENEKHLEVKAEDWEADARRFHAIAKKKADAMGKPLFLCAYSFSALVFQVLSADLSFERKILLAPALETHFWYPIVSWIASIWPGLTYRTMVPDAYAANLISGNRSLIAFNHFLDRYSNGEGRADETPALIWADPDDELVDVDAVKEIASSKKKWEFRALTVANSTLPKSYHHLIVDGDALGAKEWARMTTGIGLHLEGKPVPAE